jgi:hypothetical protein
VGKYKNIAWPQTFALKERRRARKGEKRNKKKD